MQRNRGEKGKENTRNLFKKIGYIKGTFDARMGMIKDRNGNDLTKAEEIKKRSQEYTEELYKKTLNNKSQIAMNKLVKVTEFQLSYFKSKRRCC